MKRLSCYRSVLLLALLIGLLFVAPLELLNGSNSYFQTITAPDEALLQSNQLVNLARPEWDYPGELMLAAKLTPVANNFCFALKPLYLSGVKAYTCKVIGSVLRLHLISLVIMLFYIFYHNSGTSVEADPLGLIKVLAWNNRGVLVLC